MNKTYLVLFVIFIVAAACVSSQKSAIKNIDSYASENTTADSILHSLQINNELLLVYAIEDYAWTRTTTYYVMAYRNNEWKGYYYKAPQSNSFLKKDAVIAVMKGDISKAKGDSLLAYFTKNEVYKIKGDNGKDFCQTQTSNGVVTACNITDQPTSKLMMITSAKVVSSSYYAPEYFEKCCPGNEDRQKFITATGKIKEIVGTTAVQ